MSEFFEKRLIFLGHMHFKRQTWEKLKPKSATEEILDTQFSF